MDLLQALGALSTLSPSSPSAPLQAFCPWQFFGDGIIFPFPFTVPFHSFQEPSVSFEEGPFVFLPIVHNVDGAPIVAWYLAGLEPSFFVTSITSLSVGQRHVANFHLHFGIGIHNRTTRSRMSTCLLTERSAGGEC